MVSCTRNNIHCSTPNSILHDCSKQSTNSSRYRIHHFRQRHTHQNRSLHIPSKFLSNPKTLHPLRRSVLRSSTPSQKQSTSSCFLCISCNKYDFNFVNPCSLNATKAYLESILQKELIVFFLQKRCGFLCLKKIRSKLICAAKP